MLDLLKPGGIVMFPLLLCSVLALAIIIERFWTLRVSRLAPKDLVNELWGWIKRKELNSKKLRELKESAPIGRILAAGLVNAKHGREIMKESIQEEASHVVHEMERFPDHAGLGCGHCAPVGSVGNCSRDDQGLLPATA